MPNREIAQIRGEIAEARRRVVAARTALAAAIDPDVSVLRRAQRRLVDEELMPAEDFSPRRQAWPAGVAGAGSGDPAMLRAELDRVMARARILESQVAAMEAARTRFAGTAATPVLETFVAAAVLALERDRSSSPRLDAAASRILPQEREGEGGYLQAPVEAPPVIVREPSLVPVRPPLPDRAEPQARLRDPRASGTMIAPERPPPRPTDRRPVSRPMVLDVILPLIAVTIVLLVVLSWIG